MELIEIFESLTAAQIRAYIASQQEETLQLEFKTVSSSDMSSRDDRRNFAIALSGFANSAGGLVVWGIDARKNSDGIDCAVSVSEIKDVSLFRSRLVELTGDAVSPRIDGILHKTVQEENGSGFAVTFVPESDSGPHMAKLGEDRYYKRSGPSFYRMEHFDIADMFGRRRRARLRVEARVDGKDDRARIILSLYNDGRGSARAPYLAFSCPPPFQSNEYGLDGNGHEGMHRIPFRGSHLPLRYGEDENFVIHPLLSHDVASIWLGHVPSGLPRQDVEIEYLVCAESIPLETGSIVIPISQLRTM
jgi:hypothetical protein